MINFGLIYGMSAFGLARNLGIERSAATTYIERYFARYPGVKRYMDETRASAKRRATSRRCSAGASTCPRSTARNGPRRAGAERAGDQRADAGHGGRPDQAGDDHGAGRARRASGARTQMIMQVHDELVFEVPEAELDWAQDRDAAPHGRRGAS